MTKEIKKYSEKEYKQHGDILFEIGKQDAFKSILKTEVSWSVKMSNENWDLDTIGVGDGSLKNIRFIKTVLSDEQNSKLPSELAKLSEFSLVHTAKLFQHPILSAWSTKGRWLRLLSEFSRLVVRAEPSLMSDMVPVVCWKMYINGC